MEPGRRRQQSSRSALAGRALIEQRQFEPPGWLRSAHLQTILGSLPPQRWLIVRRAQRLRALAQQWLIDCGEGVRLQGFLSRAAAAPGAAARLAVLLHGWEGSSDSSYVLSLGAQLLEHNFDVLRLNLRDHGQTHHLNRDLFHSCRLPEVLGACVAAAQRFPAARLYLAGFSLGGNFLLRVAAEARAPAAIAGVVAISPVLEPEATLRALEQGWPIYRRYFMRHWTRSLRLKQRAWPGVYEFERLLQRADLRALTAELVRQCTAFPTLAQYLSGYALTGARLATLRAPASVLLADDDPMIPAQDLQQLAACAQLTLVRTRYGGHCGFVEHWARASFADRFVCERFEQFERQAQSATALAI